MFYCLNIPGLLKDQFNEALGGNFGLLLSLPQLPNCLMPFFAGMLLDKIGFRLGLFIFSMVVFVGQLVEAIGGGQDSYAWVMTGLFVYQFGTECGSMTLSKNTSPPYPPPPPRLYRIPESPGTHSHPF